MPAPPVPETTNAPVTLLVDVVPVVMLAPRVDTTITSPTRFTPNIILPFVTGMFTLLVPFCRMLAAPMLAATLLKNLPSPIKNPAVEVLANMSFPALAQLIVDQRQYDFIYVDGSHNADDALADAVMCFGLLRPGGVMLFDDYLWEDDQHYLGRCKQSIDAFVNMFYHRLKLGLVNYQLAIVKKELE
jgi:hypothetical protein